MHRIAPTVTRALATATTAAACVGVVLVGAPAQAAAGHGLDGGHDACAASTRPSTVRLRSVIIGGVERTQIRQRTVVCGYYTSQWVITARSRWAWLPVPV